MDHLVLHALLILKLLVESAIPILPAGCVGGFVVRRCVFYVVLLLYERGKFAEFRLHLQEPAQNSSLERGPLREHREALALVELFDDAHVYFFRVLHLLQLLGGRRAELPQHGLNGCVVARLLDIAVRLLLKKEDPKGAILL